MSSTSPPCSGRQALTSFRFLQCGHPGVIGDVVDADGLELRETLIDDGIALDVCGLKHGEATSDVRSQTWRQGLDSVEAIVDGVEAGVDGGCLGGMVPLRVVEGALPALLTVVETSTELVEDELDVRVHGSKRSLPASLVVVHGGRIQDESEYEGRREAGLVKLIPDF